jgi:hypothetical protein
VGAAVFGLLGVLVGGILQIVAQYLTDRRSRELAQEARDRAEELDNARKAILDEMLRGGDLWRAIDVCSKVIGADSDTTRRLLVELRARGSAGDNEVWGLIERVGLPVKERG